MTKFAQIRVTSVQLYLVPMGEEHDKTTIQKGGKSLFIYEVVRDWFKDLTKWHGKRENYKVGGEFHVTRIHCSMPNGEEVDCTNWLQGGEQNNDVD